MARPNKFIESKLRTHLAAKTLMELVQCLENIRKISIKNLKNEFISPIEWVRKNAHWEDYAASAKQIIFSLKLELTQLSDNLTPDLKIQKQESGKSFRLLFSAGKKCIQLFKGLAKFPYEIDYGKRGYKLKEEIICITHKLILFMSIFGILPANIDFKKLNEYKKEISYQNDLPLSDDATDTSINISSSDFDSDAAYILESENVRHKLSNLAKKHLAKNKKEKKGKIAYKTIQPLKKIQKLHFGVTEKLADGRRVQFIHDSLSHKLRMNDLLIDHSSHDQHHHCKPILSPLNMKVNEHHLNLHLTAPSYGISEGAADMVIDKLLPHLQAKNAKNENSNVIDGEVDQNILRIKLKNLLERLDAVEKANDRREKYAKRLEQLITIWDESEEGFMDLSMSIKHANMFLHKVPEVNYNYSIDRMEITDKYLYSGEQTIPELRRKLHDSFYDNLNSCFDVNLKTKLNNKRPLGNFPSLQVELQAKRNEFWTSLVDNNYILPSPTNTQEAIYTKGLVYDYDLKQNRMSKETHFGESLLDEHGEIKPKTSNDILTMHETRLGIEVGGNISDKEPILEVKDSSAFL